MQLVLLLRPLPTYPQNIYALIDAIIACLKFTDHFFINVRTKDLIAGAVYPLEEEHGATARAPSCDQMINLTNNSGFSFSKSVGIPEEIFHGLMHTFIGLARRVL